MVTELITIVNVAKELVLLLKDTKELISEGTQRDRLTQRIQTAENSLALAEASTAKDLGYELCRCTFPPQIMLQCESYVFLCHKCGTRINTGTTITFSQ